MQEFTWHPECVEDELLVAFIGAKRALHSTAAGDDPGTIPVLHQLAAAGDQRQTQVAAALGLDASTISRHVRSLVRSGLIAADPDPDDRRATRLSLTAAGVTRLSERLAAHRAALRAATSNFTPGERTEFIRLLNKFAQDLVSTGAQS